MKHSWSEPQRIDAQNTLRTCTKCGVVKRTRHEPDNDPPHWTEFIHGERHVVFKGDPSKTPPCGSFESIPVSLLRR